MCIVFVITWKRYRYRLARHHQAIRINMWIHHKVYWSISYSNYNHVEGDWVHDHLVGGDDCAEEVDDNYHENSDNRRVYIDSLVQDSNNSSALAMELLQSCTKPSIFDVMKHKIEVEWFYFAIFRFWSCFYKRRRSGCRSSWMWPSWSTNLVICHLLTQCWSGGVSCWWFNDSAHVWRCWKSG